MAPELGFPRLLRYYAFMDEGRVKRLAAFLTGGDLTAKADGQARQLILRAEGIRDGDTNAAARLVVRVLREITGDDLDRETSSARLFRTLLLLCPPGSITDPSAWANIALERARSSGGIARTGGGYRLTETSGQMSAEPVELWMVPGLPGRLANLARCLEENGGSAKAADLNLMLGEPPANILNDGRKKWGDWIAQHIDVSESPVYRLK